MRQGGWPPPGARAVASVTSGERPHLPWLALVGLAALAVGIAAAFLVSGGVPPQDNAEPSNVRTTQSTSTALAAGAANSPDPPFARNDPTGGDVVAEGRAVPARSTVPLDPDDTVYRREDDAGSHIGESLDPDDESATPASIDVSHIGDYLDPLDD